MHRDNSTPFPGTDLLPQPNAQCSELSSGPVNEAHNDFVFIHINKTGGTSIETALGLKLEHKTAQEKIWQLGISTWQNRFTFAFVRNPWDRVVSHYHYRVETNQTGLGTQTTSFTEWVFRAYGARDPIYCDHARFFMPQSNWIVDDKGQLLVDFVGRFETIEKDFGVVCERLGRTATLPHIKKSKHDHYRSYYNDATKQIVEKRFLADIERFGYRF